MWFHFLYTVYTLLFENLEFVFPKQASSAHQGYIYLIKKHSKNSNIVKYYYIYK